MIADKKMVVAMMRQKGGRERERESESVDLVEKSVGREREGLKGQCKCWEEREEKKLIFFSKFHLAPFGSAIDKLPCVFTWRYIDTGMVHSWHR